MAEAARIALVDDHPLLVQVLAERISTTGAECLTVEVDADVPGMVEAIEGLCPDLVLLDAVFDDDDEGGMRVLRALQESGIRIAMLTGVSDEIRQAEFLEAGATAVISKAAGLSDVLADIEAILDGRDTHGVTRRAELASRLQAYRRQRAEDDRVIDSLTKRERATLQALVDGRQVDEIALQREVATSTIRSQVRSILRKLGTNSQIKAVSIAVRHGMAPSRHQHSI